MTTIPAATSWRHYSLLLPQGSRRQPVELQLQSDADLVARDERRLGVAVKNVRTTPPQGKNLLPVLEYSLFLTAIVGAVC
jgi:hypothetical protein